MIHLECSKATIARVASDYAPEAFGLGQFLEVLQKKGLIAPDSPPPVAEDKWPPPLLIHRLSSPTILEHLFPIERSVLQRWQLAGLQFRRE